MTLMLASVTGVEEAEVAFQHGVDIIDLKDARSAFGALKPSAISATVDWVASRKPVSAVAGELKMDPDAIVAAAEAIAETGADYIKVGLYPDRRREDCIRALASLARRKSLIGVMFADDGADEALIPPMAESGFAGAMIDTANKASGRLLDHMNVAAAGRFIQAARTSGLMAGLAGSLEPPDVPRLMLLAPDVLGFRRALCSNKARSSFISGDAVDVVRALIPADPRSSGMGKAAPAKVDYRLLAARGYAPGKDDVEIDRVFVRDFVLSVRIGAYAHERNKTQDVRFDVEVRVFRADRAVADIRDVFSYDLITDSIRMIIADEHIALVEILAERIAGVLLSYPRVASVVVRVEKLEVGPGGTGVEIVRRKSADVAKVRHLYSADGEIDPKAAT
jgi:(5-formylfuran-3-yl)methyl phosphate synthase